MSRTEAGPPASTRPTAAVVDLTYLGMATAVAWSRFVPESFTG